MARRGFRSPRPMISFRCRCGEAIRVPTVLAGLEGTCSSCGVVRSIPVPKSMQTIVRMEASVNYFKSPIAFMFRGGDREEIDVQASTFLNGQVYLWAWSLVSVGLFLTAYAIREHGHDLRFLEAIGWTGDWSVWVLVVWFLVTLFLAVRIPWLVVRSLFQRYAGRLVTRATRRSLAEAGGFDIARYAPFLAFAVVFGAAWLTWARVPDSKGSWARDPWIFSAAGVVLAGLLAWVGARALFRARFSERAGLGVMLDLQLEALKQDDVSLRMRAVRYLGKQRDPRALDALVGALRDPEVQVQWAAARALGRLGDGRARTPLERATSDPQPTVRSAAAKALRKLDRTTRAKKPRARRRARAGTGWKTVYVFISSTFDDMHAERDYLVKDVLPKLREWCERRRLRLVDIDLRWGVTEQDTVGKNVVEVCLRRIDQCRPFFLCFLGQRRGWIPRRGDVADTTLRAFPDLERYLGTTSVTELEVQHALLNPLGDGTGGRIIREPSKYSFFYFREPSYLDELPSSPPVLRQVYTTGWFGSPDGDGEGWREAIEEQIKERKRPVRHYRARWDPHGRSPELALPLESPSLEPAAVARWRRQWETAGVDPAQTPQAEDFNDRITAGRLAGFEAEGAPLGDVMLEDLKQAIERRFPGQVEIRAESELEQELEQQEHFLAANTEGFVRRSGDDDEIDAYVADASDDRLFALTGPGGSGKSMLLAHWINDRRDSEAVERGGEAIYFRFIAASDSSTSVDGLLRSLFLEMKETGDLDEEIPETPAELRSRLYELLEAAGRRGKAVIVLDGLDQLETGLDDLAWLPNPLPFNIKLIVSFKRAGEEAERLYERWRRSDLVWLEEMRAFDESQREQLVDAYLSLYLKELDPQYMQALITSEGAENPLYLKVVLSELRVFGVASQLADRLRRDFGSNPVSAFEGFLRRLEQDPAYAELDPPIVVPLIFGLLAHARAGLTEDELADLVEAAYPPEAGTRPPRGKALEAVNFYLRQARPYLARRQGKHVFFYDSFRVAARQLCVTAARPAEWWHGRLVDYFDGQPLPGNTRKTSELPWQQIHACRYAELERTLCSLEFIEAKCVAGGTYDLVEDYALARARGSLGLDRVRLYEQFVTAHAHVFVRDPHEVIPFAYNYASEGPVVDDAVARLESREWRKNPWVLLKDRPRLITNPALVGVLEGHRGAVNSVALTADGTRIVSGSADGTVRVWDPARSASLRTIRAHADGVNDVAVTPDGSLIASGGGDENVRVWEAESGVLRASFWRYKQPGAVNSVALAADGSQVVSGGEDGKLKVWNVETEEQEAVLPGHFGPVNSVDLTLDGRLAVSGGFDGSLRLWDVWQGGPAGPPIYGSPVSIQGADLDAYGAVIASSGGNRAGPTGTAPRGVHETDVRFRRADGQLIYCGAEHEIGDRGGVLAGVIGSIIYDIAITPDARRAVSGGYDKTVWLWDVENRYPLRKFTGHTDSVLSVAIDGTGSLAATGGLDRTIRVWRLDGETAPPARPVRRIEAVGKGARVRIDERIALMLRNRTIQSFVVIPLISLALAAALVALTSLFVGPPFGSWLYLGLILAGAFIMLIPWFRWRWMLASDPHVWRTQPLPTPVAVVIGLLLLPASLLLKVVDCPVCGRHVCGRRRMYRCGSCGWRDTGRRKRRLEAISRRVGQACIEDLSEAL